MITYNAVRKRERPQLLEALDNIISSKEDETLENLTITNTSQERLDSPKDFMEKYEPLPAIEFKIDNIYFKKAYGYSFFIILVMFVLFYLLLESGNDYLLYIIISLFAFSKVLIDWMGFYKLRERLEKQKGSTYYFDQLKYLFDGLLFILIRYVINKVKS